MIAIFSDSKYLSPSIKQWTEHINDLKSSCFKNSDLKFVVDSKKGLASRIIVIIVMLTDIMRTILTRILYNIIHRF
jgi:hypothetical protein